MTLPLTLMHFGTDAKLLASGRVDLRCAIWQPREGLKRPEPWILGGAQACARPL